MLVTRVLKALASCVAILSILAALGCGTYNSGGTVINPQGNFSNASLNGAYVYEIHGASANNLGTFNPYREVGVFIADGQGNIGKATPGSDDTSFSATGVGVTGTYTIAKDGTGSITMTGQLGTINLAVTMVSNSKAYLMEADGAGTTGLAVNAVGVAELQSSAAAGATPTGPFAFRIHQEVSLNGGPESQVGAFNASTSGINGAMDQNAAGTLTSPSIDWIFNAPGALGRGTGTYTNSATNATNNFIYYIVSSSKVDILVTDTGVVGSGSAEAQSGAIGNGLSGTYAFGSAGDDVNAAGGFFGTIATVGEFNASGGNMTGVEDTDVDGTITSSVATADCYTASANGRVAIMSLSGNSCSTNVVQVFWMVNPNRAFFLDASPTLFDDGTADLQTVSNFSLSTLSGQFALIMGGIDSTPLQSGLPIQMLTRVGTLQFNSGGKLTLNELANASDSGGGGQSPGILTGSQTTATNGRVTGSVSNGGGGVDFVMYAASGSEAYVLQNDSGVITAGTLELQP